MEEFQGTLLEAHQHVFDTFDKFGAVLDDARIGDAIADILSTAGRNRQLYVELMQGFNSSAVGGLAARYIRPGDPWDEPSLLAARLQGGRADGAEEAWHVVAGPVGDSHLKHRLRHVDRDRRTIHPDSSFQGLSWTQGDFGT
jgi:hypothetical protein